MARKGIIYYIGINWDQEGRKGKEKKGRCQTFFDGQAPAVKILGRGGVGENLSKVEKKKMISLSTIITIRFSKMLRACLPSGHVSTVPGMTLRMGAAG